MKQLCLSTFLFLSFLSINGQNVPDRVDLRFQQNGVVINYHDWGESYKDTVLVSTTYEGIRVGEYYWMNKNFHHALPFDWDGWRNNGQKPKYDRNLGIECNWNPENLESFAPLTQTMINWYMEHIIAGTWYNVNLNDFIYYFGRYYDRYSINNTSNHGLMYEGNNQDTNGWELPFSRDYRQLFASCRFYETPTNLISRVLDEIDVRTTLGACLGENPMTIQRNNPGHGIHWHDACRNDYGFSLMPSGARVNGPTSVTNGLFEWNVDKGDLYHMFYAVDLATKENMVCIHDRLDTDPDANERYWHWFNVRWCRPLTDQELGYKLYVSIDGHNLANSTELREMNINNNEIALLKKIKSGDISPDAITIYKIPTSAPASSVMLIYKGTDAPRNVRIIAGTTPANAVILPKGYLRGFFVKYFSETNMQNIVNLAINVDDNILDLTPQYNLQTRSADLTDESSGITKNNNEKLLKAVKNGGSFDLTYPLGFERVAVYTVQGNLIGEYNLPQSGKYSIPANGMAQGVYVLKFSGQEAQSIKVLNR